MAYRHHRLWNHPALHDVAAVVYFRECANSGYQALFSAQGARAIMMVWVTMFVGLANIKTVSVFWLTLDCTTAFPCAGGSRGWRLEFLPLNVLNVFVITILDISICKPLAMYFLSSTLTYIRFYWSQFWNLHCIRCCSSWDSSCGDCLDCDICFPRKLWLVFLPNLISESSRSVNYLTYIFHWWAIFALLNLCWHEAALQSWILPLRMHT